MIKEAEIKDIAKALEELYETDLYIFKYIKGFAHGALLHKNQNAPTKEQKGAWLCLQNIEEMQTSNS